MSFIQCNKIKHVEHLSDVPTEDRFEGLAVNELATGQTWVWSEQGFWRQVKESEIYQHWG